MKKLTASIFASLLTVVTVGAANANIASQGYVDEKVGTVTNALESKADKTELGNYATTAALTSGLAGKLDTTGTAARATADADGNNITATYATKTELSKKADSATVTALDKAAEKVANRVTTVSVDSTDQTYPTAKAVWDIVQAETADVASTGDLSALTTRVTTAEGEIDTLQTDMAGKANTADLGNLATLDTVGSAQITDGSITSTDISATAAIKKTQLETGVQTSLGLADTALQKSGQLTQGHLLTTDASGNIIDAGAKGALASMDTVGSAQITDGAVATADIADEAVTEAKLSDTVNASLDKADSALQQADLADYAKTAEVASTYETKENAASTYETKANASATYETKTNAASTYIPKVNAEGSDGKYVLTATAVNGTATYKWELIAREGAAE